MQWRIQGRGPGGGGRVPSLLDQMKGPKKFFFETGGV